MSSTSSNPPPIALPRFSPAALLLALALAAMLSMVVGIAAYTVHTGSGISQGDLAAAQHSAYQRARSSSSEPAPIMMSHDRWTALTSAIVG